LFSEALNNAEDAIGLWIENAKEFSDPLPLPKGRKLQYA